MSPEYQTEMIQINRVKAEIYDSMQDIMSSETPQNAQQDAYQGPELVPTLARQAKVESVTS